MRICLRFVLLFLAPRQSGPDPETGGFPPKGISRARTLAFLRAVFALIRRLHKSPQYFLVISHG